MDEMDIHTYFIQGDRKTKRCVKCLSQVVRAAETLCKTVATNGNFLIGSRDCGYHFGAFTLLFTVA